MDVRQALVAEEQSSPRHPWETARERIVGSILARHCASALHAGAGVLDVGCGDGFILSSFAQRFPNAQFVGYDPGLTRSAATAIETNRIRAITDLSDSRLERDSISAVLILDVLEHVEYDTAFLEELRNHAAVRGDATFLICVPAFRTLYRSHDYVMGHYRRYSNAALRAAAETSGLTVIDAGYFFQSFLSVRAVEALLERMGIREDSNLEYSSTWPYGKAATAAVLAILHAEHALSTAAKVFGISLPGLSTYVVATSSPSTGK